MPVLGTKLHVPTSRRRVVPRPRLTDALLGDPRSMPRLVLVAAQAGFGKTTVLTLPRPMVMLGVVGGPLTLTGAGVVEVRKGYVGKYPRTWLALSPAGRRALHEHLAALQRIATAVDAGGGP